MISTLLDLANIEKNARSYNISHLLKNRQTTVFCLRLSL